MTVTTTTRTAGPYTGTGSVSVYPFAFKVFLATDVMVQFTSASGMLSSGTLGTDYSVSLNVNQDSNPGGNVILTNPLASGAQLTIGSQVPLSQTVVLTNSGGFYPQVISDALDKITILIQQALVSISGAIRVPEIGSAAQILPPAAQRAGNLLGFDGSGNPIAVAAAAQSASALALALAADTGFTLIRGKRTDIAAATAMTLQSWVNKSRVNVLQVGVTGDGVTDDAPLLNTLAALGIPLFIPYTTTGYKIGSSVTIQCDVWCEGFFNPLAAIGSGVHDYDRFAFIILSGGYSSKRHIYGLKVAGSVALRAANVSGIRNDCENSWLMGCHVYQLNYGIVARMFSQTYTKCNAEQCNTNFAAYARGITQEVNTLTIDGGNYDSAVNVAINIGDTSWSDALNDGSSHGVVINIIGAVNTDGAESRMDNVGTVVVEGCYAETTNTDCLWRIGGFGPGSVRNARFSNNFWKTARYGVKCTTAVQALEIGPNYLSGIQSAEVKLFNEIYGISYRTGVPVGSFSQGPGPVAIAFGSVPIASVTFGGFSIDADYMIQGVQRGPSALLKYYPAGGYVSGASTFTDIGSAAAARYATPAGPKNGTVAGSNFTFTTLSDCYAFNGGDSIVTAPAGAVYIRSVDYATGIAVIDGGVTAPGAATISQVAPQLLGTTTTFSNTAPTTGTWLHGSIAWNGAATVGQPKGWQCTVTGTPGTWVSMGNL